MRLDILIGPNRFIAGPGQLDTPFEIPPFEFGNVRPIELHAWRKSADGSLIAVDLSDYQLTLELGKSNSRPTLGFWQLTTTEGTSLAIPVRAPNADVQNALQHGAFTACTVEGGSGSYIVTLAQPGVWANPTAAFQGNTLSGVLVFEITPGTTTTPAQYRVEILEVAPARIIPADWSAGNTTPTNTFTQVSGRLWELVLDADVDNGFFTLTVDGLQTDFISFNGGAQSIAVALSAAGKPAQVMPNGQGGYWVNFSQTTVAASIGGNLVILPFSIGNFDLTSSGIRELLDGLQFTDVKLDLILVKDGNTETVSADAMLVMPVNQPAVITIDAPQMAGLTFSVSDDQAYLNVYVNGEFSYAIPLNAP